jgi:hypothetical protein
MFEAAKKEKGGSKLSQEKCNTIMKRHNDEFDKLHVHQKAYLEMRAKARTEGDMERIEAEREKVDVLIGKLAEEHRLKMQSKVGMLRLSQSRWSDEEMEELRILHNSDAYSWNKTEELHRESGKMPRIMSVAEAQELRRLAAVPNRPDVRPMFNSLICWNRDSMRGVTLIGPQDGHVVADLFVFALQKPLVACFTALKVLPRGGTTSLSPAVDAFETPEREQISSFQHEFEVLLGSFKYSDKDYVGVKAEDLQALPGCYFMGGRRVVSDEDIIPLVTLLAGLPEQVAPREAKEKPAEEEGRGGNWWERPEYLDIFPWLADLGKPVEKKRAVQPQPTSVNPPNSGQGPRTLSDDDFDRIFWALRLKQAEFVQETMEEQGTHFRTSLHSKGKKWLKATTDTTEGAYERFQAKAISYEAEVFCIHYDLQVSFSADVSAHKGSEAACLCRAWEHRMTFYYTCYDESNEVLHKDELRDLGAANYEEPDYVKEILEGPAVFHETTMRLDWIRSNIFPKPGRASSSGSGPP